LRALRRRTLTVKAWQIALLVIFLIVWEVAPRAGWINPMLTSYPSAWAKMAATLSRTGRSGSIPGDVRSTVIGFVGGMAIGTPWRSHYGCRRSLSGARPFIVVLNALPKIALVPIFYIWLGDMMSIYGMAVAVSVFVTVLMLYTGFQAIDPDKVKLVRLFGASRRQILTKIVLPGSVPTMISRSRSMSASRWSAWWSASSRPRKLASAT